MGKYIPMERKAFVFILFILQNTGILYAQWTKEDSLWLDNVLSGKEQLRLNSETLKAIEDGTFINMQEMSPKEQMKTSPVKILIAKDFSEYINPKKFEMPKYSKAAFAIPKSVIVNAQRPSGKSFDDMLRSIFQPTYRAQVRNQKNANAWRTY